MRGSRAGKYGGVIVVGALVSVLAGAEAAAQARLLTFDEVRAIAVATVPGARDLEIELRTGGGGAQGLYEVELHDGRGLEHELGIDAVSGAVLYDQIDD